VFFTSNVISVFAEQGFLVNLALRSLQTSQFLCSFEFPTRFFVQLYSIATMAAGWSENTFFVFYPSTSSGRQTQKKIVATARTAVEFYSIADSPKLL